MLYLLDKNCLLLKWCNTCWA